jgi:hypothetical protein
MDNYAIEWLTCHWVIGLCLAVMCFISVGIVIASVRAIDDDYYHCKTTVTTGLWYCLQP